MGDKDSQDELNDREQLSPTRHTKSPSKLMDAASSGEDQENIINGQVQLKAGLQSGKNRSRKRNKKRV